MPTPTLPVQLVADQAGIDAVCAAITSDTALPLDTEFARTDTYRPKLCLVQVGTPAGVFCVDMLCGLDVAALWAAIADARRRKVLHAAKQDLEVLMQRFGALPAPVFDTQLAAGLLGYPPQAGYASLVAAELGVRLDKTQTRTDWSRRPLSRAQIDYAANDVAHLPALGDRLQERLARAGRDGWALEDSAALLDPGLYEVRPDQAWQRLPAVEYQAAPVQARAMRLAAWREQRAARADRPRQWILPDQALLALASAAPATTGAMEALGAVPAGVIRNSGTAILEELRQAGRDLEAGVLAPVQLERPAPTDNARLKSLGSVVQRVAGELGIAPEILATRADLARLLRGERGLRPLRGWRRQVIGTALLAAV